MRDGNVLIAPPLAALGPVCLKCGTDQALQSRTQVFYWHPPWIYALLLLRVLPYIIGALVTRKKATLTYSLCETHFSAMRRAKWFGLLSILAIIAGSVALGVQRATANDVGTMLVVLLAMLVAIVAIARLWIAPTQIQTRKIIKLQAEFTGIAPEALDRLVPEQL